MMIKVKNHQTPPTIRPDRDLHRGKANDGRREQKEYRWYGEREWGQGREREREERSVNRVCQAEIRKSIITHDEATAYPLGMELKMKHAVDHRSGARCRERKMLRILTSKRFPWAYGMFHLIETTHKLNEYQRVRDHKPWSKFRTLPGVLGDSLWHRLVWGLLSWKGHSDGMPWWQIDTRECDWQECPRRRQ